MNERNNGRNDALLKELLNECVNEKMIAGQKQWIEIRQDEWIDEWATCFWFENNELRVWFM